MDEKRTVRTVARWMAAGAGFAVVSYATYACVTWWRYGHAAPSTGDEADALLDRFMPAYEVVVRHDARVAAPAWVTVMAASAMDIQRSAIVRAIFKGRMLILGSDPEARERPRTLLRWMEAFGWIVLAEVPRRAVVVGTITQPWKASPTPRVVPPAEFLTFDEPDYVKIASVWAAEPLGSHASRFTIRTRVATTGTTARRRFRRYWSVFSPGSLLIRFTALGLARSEAERQAREAASLPVSSPPLAATGEHGQRSR
jgi:hypothetical protein